MEKWMQAAIKEKKERAAMLVRYANPKSRNKPTMEKVTAVLELHIPYAGTVRPEILNFTIEEYGKNTLIKWAHFTLELSDGRTIRIDAYEHLKGRTPEEKEADKTASFPSGLFRIFSTDITPVTKPEEKDETETKNEEVVNVSYKHLLGATTDGEIVFGEFGITTRNGYPEFSASFDTVRPFTTDELEDVNEYYEDLIDGCFDDAEKYRLCERYNCRPADLAEHMAEDPNNEEYPFNMRDCSLFPEVIDVDGVDFYFESGSCGQHNTRGDMAEYVNKAAYDAIHALWDSYHLKHVDETVIEAVERLQADLSSVDVEEWIAEYIQREIVRA